MQKNINSIVTKISEYYEIIRNQWFQFSDKQKNLILASGISIIAIIIWLQYGIFKLHLEDDMGIYLYGAKELIDGNIPYVNLFEVKPPITFIVPAGGFLVFSNLLGLSYILASRITMLLLGGGTVFFTYLLSYHLFKNRIQAILSAIILLTVTVFGWAALSGRIKLIMVFFSIACLYAIIRKKLFIAGILGSLAALSWQPGALLPLSVILYAMINKKLRKEQLIKSIIGAALPVIIIAIFFLIMGGLNETINQTILFTFTFKSTLHWGVFSAINNLIYAVIYFLGTEILFIILGFLGFIIYLIKKRKDFINLKSHIPFVFLPFILLILYSLYDFQSWHDAIPLLPFIAIFASYFLIIFGKKIGSLIQQKTRLSGSKISTYVIIILLLLTTFYGLFPLLRNPEPVREIISEGNMGQVGQMISEGNFIGAFPTMIEDVGFLRLVDMLFLTNKDTGITLGEQIEFAEYIETNSNKDQRLLFVSVPDIMFLSNRRNINRYILYPVDKLYLQETGELADYQEQVMDYKPLLIIVKKHSDAEYNTSSFEDFIIPSEIGLTEFIKDEYEIAMQTNIYGVLRRK
jgi:hypothetical protein